MNYHNSCRYGTISKPLCFHMIRCTLAEVMVEMDRILRPHGTVIIRDTPAVLKQVSKIAAAVQWKFQIFDSEPGSAGGENILVATKQFLKAEVEETQ